jgi:hypothetical protein
MCTSNFGVFKIGQFLPIIREKSISVCEEQVSIGLGKCDTNILPNIAGGVDTAWIYRNTLTAVTSCRQPPISKSLPEPNRRHLSIRNDSCFAGSASTHFCLSTELNFEGGSPFFRRCSEGRRSEAASLLVTIYLSTKLFAHWKRKQRRRMMDHKQGRGKQRPRVSCKIAENDRTVNSSISTVMD